MGNKYLYLMGASGSGKTTLAMNLEEYQPSQYHRVVEVTTRPPRDNEKDGFDYIFLSPEEYEANRGQYFERVEYQFSPYKYGARPDEVQADKWNIVVVSIEGFLSSVLSGKTSADESHILVNIVNDVKRDIERDGRVPDIEEKFNLSVLKPFQSSNDLLLINGNEIPYVELKLSKLKEIRNNAADVLGYFGDICK